MPPRRSDPAKQPGRARHARRVQGGIALGLAALAFLAAEIFLHPILGYMADAIVVPLLLVSAWYFGIRATVATWALAFAFHILLEARVHGAIAWADDIFNAATGLAIGLTFAWLVKLRDRVWVQRAEIAASEARFRRLTEASFEGIVIHDAGLILEVNAAFAKIFGYASEELVGKHIDELTTPASAERVRQALASVSGAPVEYACRRRDGTPFDAEVRTREIVVGERRLRVAAVRDTTRRKQEEIVLRRNERLAALGTLVAGIAHEMNNPLTYIRGNLELVTLNAKEIATAGSLEDARSKAVEIAEDSAVALQGIERLASLAQGLRRVARPETHVRRPTSVNSVVGQMIPIVRARASGTTTIATRLDATRLVYANEEEITQILLNLALNALDAIATRGDRIEISTRDEDEAVVIEVRDNGPGIAASDRSRIFTPFFTTSRRAPASA